LDVFRLRLLKASAGTYEGVVQTYLGCEIEQDLIKGTTRLSQTHYFIDMLKTLGHWDYTPVPTPMIPNTSLRKEDCDMNPDPAAHCRYCGIVGSLGYLVNMTRPDLAWAYSELSKYVQFPGKPHMLAAEHVLRHLPCVRLRGTYSKYIQYSRDVPRTLRNVLWGVVDSDWAGDTETRRSHTGYVLSLNGGAISWKSRRQDSVSLSTSGAEYVLASQSGQEVWYLREVLRDFYVNQMQPTCIYEDNLACFTMSENPVRRKYSRHVDIRTGGRYFVRELVLCGVLRLVALRTQLMFADALTKGLPGPAHIQHLGIMFGTMPFGPHYTFSARLLHAEAAAAA
jgi:hypothetical protein